MRALKSSSLQLKTFRAFNKNLNVPHPLILWSHVLTCFLVDFFFLLLYSLFFFFFFFFWGGEGMGGWVSGGGGGGT